MSTMVCIERSEANFGELFLSTFSWTPGIKLRMSGLNHLAPYLCQRYGSLTQAFKSSKFYECDCTTSSLYPYYETTYLLIHLHLRYAI